MISLFIDTSLEDVSIALVKEGKELSQIHEYIPGKHSIYVTKYISDILKNNNLSPDNVDEIIVVNGPGSFTGIRIGVTIAKMFAYIKKISIVTITSLKARVDDLTEQINVKDTTISEKNNKIAELEKVDVEAIKTAEYERGKQEGSKEIESVVKDINSVSANSETLLNLIKEILDSFEVLNQNSKKQNDIIERLNAIDEENSGIAESLTQIMSTNSDKLSKLDVLSSELKNSAIEG